MNDLIVSPIQYFRHAGDTPETWDALKNQRITHCKYGPGVVREIGPDSFWVTFDEPYGGKADRRFEKQAQTLINFFTELTVPDVYVEKIQLGIRMEEAREELIRLKKEYGLQVQEIRGRWQKGWTLDQHTKSSRRRPDGGFDTTRTKLGEMVYQLKYCWDRNQISPIAEIVAAFLQSLPDFRDLRAIIPIPPSEMNRPFQPVPEIASEVGRRVNLPVPTDYLRKLRKTRPLKSLEEEASRQEQLEGAFHVVDDRFRRQTVLLFDDIYRSGETLNAVTEALLDQGGVARVYALALTRTRTKR